MNISSLEVLTQKTALWRQCGLGVSLSRATAVSIDTYQKHIYPRKGFSCPHRLLYSGLSCSDFVKEQLLHQDLFSVIGLTKKRFYDCAKASQKLAKSESSSGCIIIPCCFPI